MRGSREEKIKGNVPFVPSGYFLLPVWIETIIVGGS